MRTLRHFNYENLEELIKNCDQSEIAKNKIDKECKSQPEWMGCRNYENAKHIVRHGVDVKALEARVDQVKRFVRAQTIRPEHSMSGAVVDVPVFLSGQPECMIDFPVVEEQLFVDIVIATNDMAGISATQMNNKALGLAYLVDKLEGESTRCRIIAFSASEVDGEYHSVSTIIKDYHENMSIGQISGSTGAAFFRGLIFAHRQQHFNCTGGATCRFDQNMDIWQQTMPKGYEFIFLPNLRSMESLTHFSLGSEKSAIDWAEFYQNHKIKI